MRRDERILAGGVAAGFTLLCLAYALLLPPYEGFDETAHYSYVTLLADRGQIPDFRRTPLDATLQSDLAGLPQRYAGFPPFEANGGLTYGRFFRDVPADQRQQVVGRFWHTPRHAEYAPGSGSNWLGQHPPLYYALMSVPYWCVRDATPGTRMLVLRFCSLALACGSLVFWWLALERLSSGAARRALLLAGVSVLFLPSCWFDLGRMGNDSLAALITAAVFYLVLRIYQRPQPVLRDFVALGSAMGCGLLTKAFFVPVGAGVVACLAWLALTCRPLSHAGFAVRLWRWMLPAGVALTIAVLLAGGWFALCAQRYGMALVSADQYAWAHAAGPPRGAALSWGQAGRAMLRAVAAFGATALWSGTWSWVQRPLWHYGLMLPWLLLALWAWLGGWRRSVDPGPRPADTGRRQMELTAALILAPMLAAMLYFLALKVRFTGVGSGVGGYYLFVAWPLLGLMAGRALDVPPTRLARWLLAAAVAAAVAFELQGLWFEAQVYAGVVQKLGNVKTGVGQLAPTPANVWLVFQRLREIALPGWACACLAAALALKLAVVGRVQAAAPRN